MNAIRAGLEKVVPKAVLTLMTWQELESRICGEPEITVEALKKSGMCLWRCPFRFFVIFVAVCKDLHSLFC